ncbi:hypothetical protein GCM10028806_13910 [Spirosoma terrae]|uniref:DUF2306 domain-containing protein n=1 Tax=Spirosoma terrae TaxID=1968276 RepID=A0A6L9L3F2_9BACT|nr:hypothetical protein [Spirosoma terrae]NDU95046.1 hypothetical protein [Spirosoma terrae]
MQTLHTANIVIHVLFGTFSLIVGLVTLFYQNRLRQHVRYGRIFLYLLTVVVATAFVGILFFRSDPFLLVLTLLSGYVGYSGYRAVRLKEQKTTTVDMLVTFGLLLGGSLYVKSLQLSEGHWSPTVVYSTFSALIAVAAYDVIKHFWLYKRLKTWWLYEHIYKMMSAYSALASAFSGSVLSDYKPYSQILPSALGTLALIYFIGKKARTRKRTARSIPQLT